MLSQPSFNVRSVAALLLKEALATIPNQLTLLRVLLVPPVLGFLFIEQFLVAFVIFAAAATTDFFDGFLARRWKQGSFSGRIFDPAADKLFVDGNLIGIWYAGLISGPLFLMVGSITLAYDIRVTYRRWPDFLHAVRYGGGGAEEALSPTRVAKWKTGFQLVGIGTSIIAPVLDPFFGLPYGTSWGSYSLYDIAAILIVMSGIMVTLSWIIYERLPALAR